jgi:pyruvate,water dikinase
MKWLKDILGTSKAERLAVVESVQQKFSIFQAVLERHNQALKLISRLEERHQNRQLGSVQAVWDDVVQIQEGVREVVDRMMELGGDAYLPLRSRLISILKEVENSLPGTQPVVKDDFVIPFARLDKSRAHSVGGKNANLGEMKSHVGVPVPDGFAISAWAYVHFIEVNQLQDRIDRLLQNVRIRQYKDLEVVSNDIREMVTFRSVPDDLAEAIYAGFDELAARSPKARFALRSSAVWEDTTFTFAGQYVSFLNVGRDALLDRYKDILASKFTPSAISYLLRHSLSEMDLAMGVVCMEMVDSAASGVIYTRDPLNPSGPHLLVNSIFGLGSYLVEGRLTPDVFHVSRSDGNVTFSQVARKPVQLVMRTEGGVTEAPAPEAEQDRPSLSEQQLRLLARYALKIEEHYGEPQDIEWALDRSGELFLIQTRPLKFPKARAVARIPEEFRSDILVKGGTPICAGIGVGPIYHLDSAGELDAVPRGAVLVVPYPSPKLVAVMHQVSALVSLVGGNASHLATLARELSLPTIVNMQEAAEIPQDRTVTVDAGNGVIYDGSHPEWIPAQEEEAVPREGAPSDAAMDGIVTRVTRLSVIHPNDPNFTPQSCDSLHDILRFIHQKSMEEIFSSLKRTANKEDIGLRLKTKIPLFINIIYLDRCYLGSGSKRWVREDSIESLPMKALWEGVLQEGWPSRPVPADLKGFLAVIGTEVGEGRQPEFSENSYAFLSKEYLLLNLRMGYHFSTIEALVTPEPEKNYIRMQFKLGGAPLERRMRRIWIICELLKRIGFENFSQGDFLDTTTAYQGPEAMLERLRLLGRMTILTKQLDLTLSSDSRARWYLDDFIKKLGLEN